MTPVPPAVLARLDRAAAEISGQATSAGRRALATMPFRSFHFSLRAHDLLHILRSNGSMSSSAT